MARERRQLAALLFVGFVLSAIAQPLTVELLAACGQGIKNKATAKLSEAHRIVSLAPSNTELLFSLGAQERLIGVSTTCNYPPQAGKLEKVGSFTSINFERLARMKPDTALFVTGQGALASRLKNKQVQIVILPNDNLAKIAGNLRTLGELTGRTAQANSLAQSCERSLSGLAKLMGSVKHRPRVFYCIWPEPLLTVGNNSFINGIITSTGGKNITDNLDAAYPRYSMERLLLAQPEVIILPSNALKRLVLSKPPWSSLQAIRDKHFYILPESVEDRLSRPTLGIFDGLYWLSLRLHPELKQELDAWIEKWRATVRPQAQKAELLNVKKFSCRPISAAAQRFVDLD